MSQTSAAGAMTTLRLVGASGGHAAPPPALQQAHALGANAAGAGLHVLAPRAQAATAAPDSATDVSAARRKISRNALSLASLGQTMDAAVVRLCFTFRGCNVTVYFRRTDKTGFGNVAGAVYSKMFSGINKSKAFGTLPASEAAVMARYVVRQVSQLDVSRPDWLTDGVLNLLKAKCKQLSGRADADGAPAAAAAPAGAAVPTQPAPGGGAAAAAMEEEVEQQVDEAAAEEEEEQPQAAAAAGAAAAAPPRRASTQQTERLAPAPDTTTPRIIEELRKRKADTEAAQAAAQAEHAAVVAKQRRLADTHARVQEALRKAQAEADELAALEAAQRAARAAAAQAATLEAQAVAQRQQAAQLAAQEAARRAALQRTQDELAELVRDMM